MIKQHKNELTGVTATIKTDTNNRIVLVFKDTINNTVISVRYYNDFDTARDAALRYLDLKV
jgi:hypothetical protein